MLSLFSLPSLKMLNLLLILFLFLRDILTELDMVRLLRRSFGGAVDGAVLGILVADVQPLVGVLRLTGVVVRFCILEAEVTPGRVRTFFVCFFALLVLLI